MDHSCGVLGKDTSIYNTCTINSKYTEQLLIFHFLLKVTGKRDIVLRISPLTENNVKDKEPCQGIVVESIELFCSFKKYKILR